MNDLTGFQRDLLYAIAGLDAPHGLTIKKIWRTIMKKKYIMDDCS